MKEKRELLLGLGWGATTIILLIALVLTSKIPTLENGEEVVAKIDGKTFSINELYRSLKTQGGYSVLNTLVDKFIISKEITNNSDAEQYAENQLETYRLQYKNQGYDFDVLLKQNGYTIDVFKEDVMYQYNSNIVAENYLKGKFTEKEINNYYKTDIYEELTVRHILVLPNAEEDATDAEKQKAEDAAFKKANEILEKVKKGEDFSKLAKEYSEDTGTKENGGLYSNFTEANTDSAFYKAAYALKDGEYTLTPVKSQYGYHIILKVSNNGKPKLENVKDKVLDGLLDELKDDDENAITKAWFEIRKKYNLSIVDTDLEKIYKTMSESYK